MNIPVLAASEIMATNFLLSMNAVRWERGMVKAQYV